MFLASAVLRGNHRPSESSLINIHAVSGGGDVIEFLHHLNLILLDSYALNEDACSMSQLSQ